MTWTNDEEVMSEKELHEECQRLRNTVTMLNTELNKRKEENEKLLNIAHTLARGNF